jgi:hypothetical protein
LLKLCRSPLNSISLGRERSNVIRSSWANAFVLGLGMLLVALAFAVGLAAVRENTHGGFIGFQNVVPGLLVLGLGIWCVRGAAANFSRASSQPRPGVSWSVVALRGFVFVLCAALVGALVGALLLARGHDGVLSEGFVLASAATLTCGALAGFLVVVIAVVRRKQDAA